MITLPTAVAAAARAIPEARLRRWARVDSTWDGCEIRDFGFYADGACGMLAWGAGISPAPNAGVDGVRRRGDLVRPKPGGPRSRRTSED